MGPEVHLQWRAIRSSVAAGDYERCANGFENQRQYPLSTVLGQVLYFLLKIKELLSKYFIKKLCCLH